MLKLKFEIEVTKDNFDEVLATIGNLSGVQTVKSEPAKKKPSAEKPAKDKPEVATPKEEPKGEKISMTDIRALALRFTKSGNQAKLKEIFAKYKAEKLSDIAESDYEAVLADLSKALEG